MALANAMARPRSNSIQDLKFMDRSLSQGYKLSITPGQYEFLPDGYLMPSMNTVFETRRMQLKKLVDKYETVARLNRALGWEETNARLYQIHNRSIRKSRGTPYVMGDPTAREIEGKLGLDVGWLDTPPGTHWPFSGVSQTDYQALTAEQRGIIQGRLAGMIEAMLVNTDVAKSNKVTHNVYSEADMEIGEDKLFLVGTLHHAAETRQANKQRQ